MAIYQQGKEKKKGKSVDNISLQNNNVTIELNTQRSVEEAIKKNNSARFSLAYGTPLLNGSKLHKDLGTLADTDHAQNILDGKYTFTSDTDRNAISM